MVNKGGGKGEGREKRVEVEGKEVEREKEEGINREIKIREECARNGK